MIVPVGVGLGLGVHYGAGCGAESARGPGVLARFCCAGSYFVFGPSPESFYVALGSLKLTTQNITTIGADGVWLCAPPLPLPPQCGCARHCARWSAPPAAPAPARSRGGP